MIERLYVDTEVLISAMDEYVDIAHQIKVIEEFFVDEHLTFNQLVEQIRLYAKDGTICYHREGVLLETMADMLKHHGVPFKTNEDYGRTATFTHEQGFMMYGSSEELVIEAGTSFKVVAEYREGNHDMVVLRETGRVPFAIYKDFLEIRWNDEPQMPEGVDFTDMTEIDVTEQ